MAAVRRRQQYDRSDGDRPDHCDDFIEEISKALDNGYGFVPLIGAGFSAPSGAPLTWELKEYLQRCICIGLRKDAVERDIRRLVGSDRDIEPWNPRTDRWPPMIDRRRRFRSGHWADRIFNEITRLRRSEDDQAYRLLVEGHGAMQDWRTALLFLSRLDRPSLGFDKGLPDRHSLPTLVAPSQEVIDACFREVLREIHPTLGHRMLAALGGALRLDLVMTTNFDDLLERAFEAARNTLSVFEVPLGGTLPDAAAVSNVRALIKLHGGRASVRADYSLDQPASEEDKQRFLEYFLAPGARMRTDRDPTRGLAFRSHLLVCGVAGSDRRVLELIDHARQHLDSDFRVFWVCYSDDDEQKLKRRPAIAAPRRDMVQPMLVLRHRHSGLLLFQLYQALRKSLPPLGTIFPSVARQTLPPLEPAAITRHLDRGKRQIASVVERLTSAVDDGERLVVVYPARRGVPGVTSVCARAFRTLEAKPDVIAMWIDLNDVTSGDNLYEIILEALYYRLGLEDWIPSTSGAFATGPAQIDLRRDEIERLVTSVNRSWVVFLNARESPGANAQREVVKGNGWLDRLDTPRGDDESGCRSGLLALLRALCTGPAPVSVVLLCRRTKGLVKALHREAALRPCTIEVKDAPALRYFDEEQVVRSAIEWTKGTPARTRFIHGLVLMQRPRLLATLWSPALLRSPADGAQVAEWIEELEKKLLVRRKPGGFIWVHAGSRQLLRSVLRGVDDLDDEEERQRVDDVLGPPDSKVRRYLEAWKPRSHEAEVHKKIASWYENLLDASDTPAAAFESAYHFCEAALALRCAGEFGRAAANVDAAAALVKANSFLIQTHGYSRGSCRRLEFIAEIGREIYDGRRKGSKARPGSLTTGDQDKAKEVIDAVRRLWIVCVETMRAIAREVGEDAKAFRRHRQVGRLLTDINWPDVVDEPPQSPPPDKKSISQQLKAHFTRTDSSDSSAESAPAFPHLKTDRTPFPVLVRWWRWTAMLALQSRSYELAESRLTDVLGPFGKLTAEQRWVLKTESERVQVLRAIEQAVQLRLLQFHVRRRLACSNGELPGLDLSVGDDVLPLIERGVALAEKVRDADRSSDSHYVAQANWAEARLLMHKSVIRVNSKDEGRFVEALAALGAAESKLRVSDIRKSRSELALLDLHRAAVRLHEAEQTAALLPTHAAPSTARQKAAALVADSVRFLDRAAPVLRQRRRNVRWTTWYFERKLRATALAIRLASPDAPIPFLGLEAAMRMTETEADRLIGDAKRMIRVDSYRLATIVEAYGSCLKELVDKKVPLPKRTLLMKRELERALATLDSVHRARLRDRGHNGMLDTRVRKYVERVLVTLGPAWGRYEGTS